MPTATDLIDSSKSLADFMPDGPDLEEGVPGDELSELELSAGVEDTEEITETGDETPGGAAVVTPTDETPTPEGEAVPAVVATADPELQQFADLGRSLQDSFARDPEGFLTQLIKALPDEAQRQRVLGQFGMPQSSEAKVGSDEELLANNYTPEEIWVLRNRESMDSLKAFPDQIRREIDQRDEIIGPALAEVYALREAVAGMAEMLGIAVPELNRAELGKQLQAGKSLSDAIKAVHGPAVKEAVGRVEQAKKALAAPNTPGAGSGQAPRPKKGASLYSIMRENGLL